MTVFSGLGQTVLTPDDRVLRAAVAAYLGRYRDQSRLHTGSDLKIFLTWCTGQGMDPLRVGRADIERYVRWPGVSLRVVQIAAPHADPRTTMRYDRARKNLDRHPNYLLAAYLASGT